MVAKIRASPRNHGRRGANPTPSPSPSPTPTATPNPTPIPIPIPIPIPRTGAATDPIRNRTTIANGRRGWRPAVASPALEAPEEAAEAVPLGRERRLADPP